MQLSLLGLECILEHMDANIRFRISQYCPALRRIEKRVPLKIDNLNLSEYQFTVNNTIYRLGVFVQYPKNLDIPEKIQKENDAGGDQCDLDIYGFKTVAGNLSIIPEDLVFDCRLGQYDPSNYSEITKKEMESKLYKLKNELAFRIANNITEAYEPSCNDSISCYSESYSRPMGSYSTEELYLEIRNSEANLLPYQLINKSAQPPWERVLQLTIFKPLENHKRDVLQIQRGKYFGNLGQCMRMIYQFFFGGRAKPVQVNSFCTKWGLCGMVLRLPQSLKFQIKQLFMLCNFDIDKVCDFVYPLISTSTFPLEKVETREYTSHPIIINARKLNFHCCYREFGASTEYFLGLRNREVFMSFANHNFNLSSCIPIIQNWLETGKDMGTCFKFAMHDKDVRTLEGIKNRYNGYFRDRFLILPMDNNISALQLSFDLNVPERRKHGGEYIFKMEVVGINRR